MIYEMMPSNILQYDILIYFMVCGISAIYFAERDDIFENDAYSNAVKLFSTQIFQMMLFIPYKS